MLKDTIMGMTLNCDNNTRRNKTSISNHLPSCSIVQDNKILLSRSMFNFNSKKKIRFKIFIRKNTALPQNHR